MLLEWEVGQWLQNRRSLPGREKYASAPVSKYHPCERWTTPSKLHESNLHDCHSKRNQLPLFNKFFYTLTLRRKWKRRCFKRSTLPTFMLFLAFIILSNLNLPMGVQLRGRHGTFAFFLAAPFTPKQPPKFLAIFRNEITTILAPSTSERGEWWRRGWSRVFVLEVPDHSFTILIYIYTIYMFTCKVFQKKCNSKK